MFEGTSSSPKSKINDQTSYFNHAGPEEIARVATTGKPIEELLGKEWLLTNERGSFASSTIAACNTSGYHGLLVGSPDPLVRRILALSNCLETVLWNGRRIELSTFEFADRFAPEGYVHLHEFRRDIGAHFVFHTEPADLRKSVYLARTTDTVLVEYTFAEVREPFDFILRPFIGMRDFHMLQRSTAPLVCRIFEATVCIENSALTGGELRLTCPDLRFQNDPQWWFNFQYRVNEGRGLAHAEDLWAPGLFQGQVNQPGRLVFQACLCEPGIGLSAAWVDPEEIKKDLREHQERLLQRVGAEDKVPRVLCLAADQFVARRQSAVGERTTIVAGFPWFADWGRDTFISLPGLLLVTGRHEEAGSVLRTFAAALDEGMIPNRFDDRTGEAQFNSVDASLWFIHAAFEYLAATGNIDEFSRQLFPAIRTILDAYRAGTRFGIHADADGLITAGDQSTQLTWMDAQCDGIAFTPRGGKAVEINALWHNALRRTQKFCEQRLAEGRTDYRRPATDYRALAERVGHSFCQLFWNARRDYLNDAILPDGTVDTSLRPNQVFAISLPHGPPLTRTQQWSVVNAVEQQLLTPYGPRTLSRRDPAYRGRFEGPLRQRDEAYHQGTVWPYLMGPFIEAYLKVRDYSGQSKSAAARLLRPLLCHLTDDGCLGSVAEVFDGDPVHRPGGCPAQAWSVAELLRIYRILLS